MDYKSRIAPARLKVLLMAKELKNVSEACKRGGMDRTSFYKWKRRYNSEGIRGLEDLPPVPKTSPQRINDNLKAKIVDLSLDHPSYGCRKLEKLLDENSRLNKLFSQKSRHISNVSIQKILIENGIASRYDRWLYMEDFCKGYVLLSEEQRVFIEKYNPCFHSRSNDNTRPGEMLAQDSLSVFIPSLKKKVYCHSVVDIYGSFGFSLLQLDETPLQCISILLDRVIPFYKSLGQNIQSVLTDKGKAYQGNRSHPYDKFLKQNDIQHVLTDTRDKQSNGFIKRYQKTISIEFFKKTLIKIAFRSINDLQLDLDTWVDEYNYKRPHLGYRNYGNTPWAVIDSFIKGTPVIT